jgi:two-component system LytT family sensor kinase
MGDDDRTGQAGTVVSARGREGRSRGVKIAVGLLAWSAIGVIFAIPGLSGAQWRQNLFGTLAQWWAWGLLSLVIVAIDRRLPIPIHRIGLRLIAHVPLSLVVTSASLYLATAIRAAMGLMPWSSLAGLDVLYMAARGFFYWAWLIYWVITGAWFARHYHERFQSSELRAEKAERLFSEARLNALRMQLDPHFLFNALHAISSQIDAEPALARQMIEHLGNLLRSSLNTKDKQLITLSEEMLVLEHYLEIQRIRFGRRFTFLTDISESVRTALIPSLMMQPLVENAIRHGISKRREGGTVTVSAHRENERLHISVEDDGVGLPAGWTPGASEGLGLSITRQRVTALHADSLTARLTIGPRPGGGTRVDIVMPYQTEAAAASAPAPAVEAPAVEATMASDLTGIEPEAAERPAVERLPTEQRLPVEQRP